MSPERLEALRQKLKAARRASPAAVRLANALLGESDPARIGNHCVEDLPVYVDAELAGADVSAAYPAVKHHLDLCERCAAQYQDLLQFALQEASESVEAPADMPALDLSFLPPPSTPELVRPIAEAVLERLAPDELPDLAQMIEAFLRRMAAIPDADLLHGAYTATLGGRPFDAPSVLTFVYYVTQMLRQQRTPTSADEWERVVQALAHQAGHALRLSDAQVRALAEAYLQASRPWRSWLAPGL